MGEAAHQGAEGGELLVLQLAQGAQEEEHGTRQERWRTPHAWLEAQQARHEGTMMARSRYFILRDDLGIPGRWHLRSPLDERGEQVDTWQFKEGRRLDIQGPIRFPVRPSGEPLEFTLSSFTIPVLHERVASVLERLPRRDEVQLIPVRVEGRAEPCFILNALRIIRCIDDARCEEVLYWSPEDGEPEKVGKYRNVRGMKVDPAKAGGVDVLRAWGWVVPLIVSERVKRALEQEGVTGTDFTEV
jgi:hypothetical protein